ncbi:AzlC family ABC transporter permease [Celerinatantimonas sp. MCCC 1A17872]|uniref:AzlC family ABC transporter permease n=1 Tax=Celerinatantimonas sp. MCCC 1A17872 TaxID=3177514 RepID=UPI0038C76D81
MRYIALGLRDSLAIMAGYIPVSFSFGLTAQHAGLSAWMTMAVSMFVYAGASQFVLVGLVAAGAGVINTLVAVLLINVRHLFYGPSIARFFSGHKERFPLAVLAYGLTDEVFASASGRLAEIEPAVRRRWFFGVALGAYSSWLLGTALGLILGQQLASGPAWLNETISFVLPALFASLLLEIMHTSGLKVIIASAVITAALLPLVASHWAMLLGMIGGAAFAMLRRNYEH